MTSGDGRRTREATGEYADATRESYRIVVSRAFAIRESNSRLARDFFEMTVEEVEAQARLNSRTALALAEHAGEQGDILREFTEQKTGVHEELLDSLPEDMRE